MEIKPAKEYTPDYQKGFQDGYNDGYDQGFHEGIRENEEQVLHSEIAHSKTTRQLYDVCNTIIDNHKSYIDDLIGEGCIHCKHSEATEFFKAKELDTMILFQGIYHKADCAVITANTIMEPLRPYYED